jgi:hypothetical protein
MKYNEKNSMKDIFIQCGLILFIASLLLFTAASVSAEDTVMRRYGLFVGSNYGGRERVTLSYAVTDARAISEVMQQLGGVMPSDSIILTDPSPNMLKHTIGEIKKKINTDTSKRSEFFFYYSGHSDEKGLLLGDTVYDYTSLKASIDSVEADVNIAVLDSCSSGAFTRMKGGVLRSPFLSDESVNASGHAFLTSSSEDEAAQESDDLEASFFTHYFVTALRGAADATLDGTVSLNEAYSYASSETLARTEETLAGPQHPSYDIQLAGTGDLVLTDLRSVSEQVMFDKALRGRIFIRDAAGRLVVELKKIEGTPLAVSIGPGRYKMILDDGASLLSADLMLTGGSKILVRKDEFYPVPRSANQVRGGTHIAADDPPTVDGSDVNKTAAELDIIAERARKRALEAAGMSPSGEMYETDSGSEKYIPGDKSGEPESEESVQEEDIPKKTEYGFDFGIIADAYNLAGIQLGAVGAHVNGDLNGFQIAGVFGGVSGDVTGAQISGVFNTADGDVNGAQVSGVWNSAHDVSLLQLGGVFNTAAGEVTGAQISGVFNTAEEKVFGAQLAGVFNTAGNVDGIQAAGIFNVAEDVKGAQIGLLNVGAEVYGLQVGLINISDELHGLPIGLINISNNGLHDLSIWYSDSGFVNFGYQLGTSSVYSFVNLGFSENWTDAATFGMGMGFELGGDSFYFDADFYGKAYQQEKGTAINNLQSIFTGTADIFPAIRLSVGMKLFDFMSIFGGVNLDCNFSFEYDSYSVEVGETAASSYSISPGLIESEYGYLKLYPTWFVGVRI